MKSILEGRGFAVEFRTTSLELHSRLTDIESDDAFWFDVNAALADANRRISKALEDRVASRASLKRLG